MSNAVSGGSRSRPRLAAASSAQYPDLFEDWQLLRDALALEGVDGTTAVWNDPAVDWTAFDLVLVSGAWDNIHHVDAFLAWVDGLVAAGVPVRNSPATLRWNIDKHYLRDLEEVGVPIVPTQWVEHGHGDDSDVDVTALALPGVEIVVKPSVSGGGFSTARYESHEHRAARAHVQQLLTAGRTAMVQPYEPRVDAEGETALIYIGGHFTHAVHKDPMIRRGIGPVENLIANQVVTRTTATAEQLIAASQALGAAEQLLGPTTYARVDMVETLTSGPALLELELLDPVLFLTEHPEGAATFARLLAEQLKSP